MNTKDKCAKFYFAFTVSRIDSHKVKKNNKSQDLNLQHLKQKLYVSEAKQIQNLGSLDYFYIQKKNMKQGFFYWHKR